MTPTNADELRVQLIVGSTRPGRAADFVLPWLLRRLHADVRLAVEVLDLREWQLPLFQEHAGSIGDPANPTYSDPVVKRWNDTLKTADGYLLLTPEYNHSIPPVVKNAIDSIYLSDAIRSKPLAFIGYSISPTGGVRAIEHLIQSALTQEAAPLRSTVMIGGVGQAFDAAGEPISPMTQAALDLVIDDLVWWGRTLRAGRASGELAPTRLRMAQAMAKHSS